MVGVVIGDIVGSVYEFDNIKTKSFPLFSRWSDYTDDSIMSLAVAKAIMEYDAYPNKDKDTLRLLLIDNMKRYGRRYPHPTGGYGGRFVGWLLSNDTKPYNSWGNGSAMRVAACGFAAKNLDEALKYAEISSAVTHNHPEAILGAKAVAGCVYLAKKGHSKAEIKDFIEKGYYTLDKTIDEIREDYKFTERCRDTVPQAIQAFLDSEDFEDAIRNAVSIGGDSDTIAAITGGIAEAFYGVPKQLSMVAIKYLPDDLLGILFDFESMYQS